MLWKSPQHECRGPYNRDGDWELDKSNSLFWKRINVFLENKKSNYLFRHSLTCHVFAMSFSNFFLYMKIPNLRRKALRDCVRQKKSFTCCVRQKKSFTWLRETEEKLYVTAWDRRKALRDCLGQKKSFTWDILTWKTPY